MRVALPGKATSSGLLPGSLTWATLSAALHTPSTYQRERSSPEGRWSQPRHLPSSYGPLSSCGAHGVLFPLAQEGEAADCFPVSLWFSLSSCMCLFAKKYQENQALLSFLSCLAQYGQVRQVQGKGPGSNQPWVSPADQRARLSNKVKNPNHREKRTHVHLRLWSNYQAS